LDSTEETLLNRGHDRSVSGQLMVIWWSVSAKNSRECEYADE